MLYLYRRVVFGVAPNEEVSGLPDMSRRELGLFIPLIILVFWMGIYPSTFLDLMSASVEELISNYQLAMATAAEQVTQIAEMPVTAPVSGLE